MPPIDERFHPPPPRVPQKMKIVWLKSQELPHQDIARLSGVCENTLRTYLQESQDGGEERQEPLNFHRPQSESCQHQATIEAALREQPPATMNEAVTRCALAQGGAQALNIELLYLREVYGESLCHQHRTRRNTGRLQLPDAARREPC
jgi:hypothetical protein